MTYQIEVRQQGDRIASFDGIESNSAGEAIDRVIRQHYKHIMLEYNNQLVVIGYEFVARKLRMWLS